MNSHGYYRRRRKSRMSKDIRIIGGSARCLEEAMWILEKSTIIMCIKCRALYALYDTSNGHFSLGLPDLWVLGGFREFRVASESTSGY